MEEDEKSAGKTVRVSSPELPFALGLFDDRRAFLARCMQKGSEQAVALYKKFQVEERKAAEVEAFLKTDLVRSDLVIELGQSLPVDIALNSIDIRESTVSLRGFARGNSDEASGKVAAYLDLLRANPRIGPKFDNISLTGLNRGVRPGQLDFELLLKIKNGGKS